MLEWSDLTKLTRGRQIVIKRVKIIESGIAVEGEFEPPPLASLEVDDQIFIAAFIRSHGSIKEMERIFGVSYPTIKSRLNRLGKALGFADVAPAPPVPDKKEILDRLSRGEITVDEATEELKRS
ncbi:MAG: DUF2089 domain-containing protein [Planctomycetota bacterium]|nr:MAG: DUF2089 domain-containing protein [Planctomycetota bacterium]